MHHTPGQGQVIIRHAAPAAGQRQSLSSRMCFEGHVHGIAHGIGNFCTRLTADFVPDTVLSTTGPGLTC